MSRHFVNEFFGLVKRSKPQNIELCINKNKSDGVIDQVGFYNTDSKEYVIYNVSELTQLCIKELRLFLKK